MLTLGFVLQPNQQLSLGLRTKQDGKVFCVGKNDDPPLEN